MRDSIPGIPAEGQTMQQAALPSHYKSSIRAFVRLALVGVSVGMLLGIAWTQASKKIRYSEIGAAPRVLVDDPSAELELPPGLHFEAGLRLKLSHGHTILILGVMPLCFASMIYLAHACGGRELGQRSLRAAFWLYSVGSVCALLLIIYRGVASYEAVHQGVFDLASVEAGLFGGSRAFRGAAYGISHSLMAIGAGVIVYQVWRAMAKPRQAN